MEGMIMRQHESTGGQSVQKIQRKESKNFGIKLDSAT